MTLRWRLVPAAAAALILALGVFSEIRAESARSLVEEGNRLYGQGRFDEALRLYDKALEAAPGEPAILYNKGNALYRRGEFDKAYDAYRQAFSAGDRTLAQGARFNAGNSHFARENWEDAIRNYHEALRLDPTDVEAKRNLELALRRLQEQEEQQQQKDGDQQENQQQDQQQEQQQPGGDQQEKPEEEPAPDPREQESANQRKEKLSREEAMRILDAMKEQDRPPKENLKVPAPDKRPEKDW